MCAAKRAAADIERLVRRWELPRPAAVGLTALWTMVIDDDQAPTAVRDPQRVADDHLADSLVALELAPVRSALRIADIGSGAGFPGLPLALALPQAEVALVESSSRKCDFLRRAVATVGVGNAEVVHARAEEWREGMGAQDLVTARAVAPLSVVAEYAAPLLRLGGVLVAWRGRRDEDAEALAASAASELGLELDTPRRVFPYRGAQHRYLHLMTKVAETPARFPRRSGTALKRPLGSPTASGASLL